VAQHSSLTPVPGDEAFANSDERARFVLGTQPGHRESLPVPDRHRRLDLVAPGDTVPLESALVDDATKAVAHPDQVDQFAEENDDQQDHRDLNAEDRADEEEDRDR